MNLLRGATNIYGPLPPEAQARIAAYLAAPSQERWSDIAGLMINGEKFRTVWQAVLRVDPSFPRVKHPGPWPRIPDAITVARAIRWAISESYGGEA